MRQDHKDLMGRPDRAKPPTIDALIAERASTHGSFKDNSTFMQAVKDLARQSPNWGKMEAYQREGVDMIAHKLGRVLYGDPNFLEHWDDCAGYSMRVAKTLRGEP